MKVFQLLIWFYSNTAIFFQGHTLPLWLYFAYTARLRVYWKWLCGSTFVLDWR